jgi:RNA polymerase sigma factor (sigma-70 family)
MSNATIINQEPNNAVKDRKLTGNSPDRRGKTNYTDQDLLDGIKLRDNKSLEFIYQQCYPMIQDLVIKYSGSQEDAQDIFQDAMIIIYNKVKKDELVLFCTFKTYLYSICKRLCMKTLEQKRKASSIALDIPKQVEAPVEYAVDLYEEDVEKYSLFHQHLLFLKEDARKLLKLYMENYSFKEISTIMGYKSESYAKTRKYAFKEELKRSILDDPHCRRFYEACA